MTRIMHNISINDENEYFVVGGVVALNICTRAVRGATGILLTHVRRILNKNKFRLYHYQLIQESRPESLSFDRER